MKTQIIQLNKNDDYISVRDKMSWSQTGRILLVWPKGGQNLNHQLELYLVKRHAINLGAQLAFVTRDAEVRRIAQPLGIPVFNSLYRAQATHWRKGTRKSIDFRRTSTRPNIETMRALAHPTSQKWLEHPATRIFCFVISVLAVFALGVFILPGAKIILTPRMETQSINLSLLADPSLSTIHLSTGSLPTYSQEVIVEGSDSTNATGSVTIPDQPAFGELRFTNISNHQVTLPEQTVVTTLGRDPIRFISLSDGKITVEPGRSISLSARSINPGTSGNLPPDALVAIMGEPGLEVTVTNPNATHGGTDALVPSPTIEDLRLLRERLVGKLEQAALKDLRSLLPGEDTLITPSLKIMETLEETSIPVVGEPGDKVSLSLRLRYQSQVVAGDVINSLVMPILDANTHKGLHPIADTTVFTQLTSPVQGEDGNAHWTIQAQRRLRADINYFQAIELINGKSIPDANARLNAALPLATQAQILLEPSWWPRLPFLTMRIQIIQPESR